MSAGSIVAVTSRNWELLRRQRPRLEVGDRLVELHGQRGLVIYAWTIPDGWDDAHGVVTARCAT